MNAPCMEIQLLLTDYGAGDLPVDQVRRVEAHTRACTECRQELANELRLRTLLGTLPPQVIPSAVPLPAPLARHRGRSRFMVGWAAAGLAAGLAAVLAVAFLAGDFIGVSGPRPQEPALIAAESPAAWSRVELDTAQDELAYSLALTARLIKRSERAAVQQVFGDKIPHAISESLNKVINPSQGDQG